MSLPYLISRKYVALETLSPTSTRCCDENGNDVVVKKIDEELSKHGWYAESKILQKLENYSTKNVAFPRLVDTYELPSALYLVLEYIPGVDLQERKLTIEEVQKVFPLLLQSVAVAHANNIVHRDLKPCNVIVSKDLEQCVVIDWGFAVDLSTNPSKSTPGTILYAAPETLLGEGMDTQSDIWSLGVLLYYLCTKKYPFYCHEGNFAELKAQILSKTVDYGREGLNPFAITLCKKIFSEREFRPTCSELLNEE